MKNTSPISNIVPLMSIDLDSSMYKAHSDEEVFDKAPSTRKESNKASMRMSISDNSSLTQNISPSPTSKVESRSLKSKSWITRMLKTVDRLDKKYSTPVSKRKPKAYMRKVKTSSIIPKEFTSLYNHLALPEPDLITVPEPYPTIAWDKVRFKPSLPNPVLCPVYGCSPDPDVYPKPVYYGSQVRLGKDKHITEYPFGSLPGYETNLGVTAVPTVPVSGYLYSTEMKKWVLHATQGGTGRGDPVCSSASGG